MVQTEAVPESPLWTCLSSSSISACLRTPLPLLTFRRFGGDHKIESAMLNRLLSPCHWDGALVQELEYLFDPEWRTAKERVARFPRHWQAWARFGRFVSGRTQAHAAVKKMAVHKAETVGPSAKGAAACLQGLETLPR